MDIFKTVAAGTAVALLLGACSPATVLVGTGAVVGRAVVQERSTFDALQDNEIALSINNALLNESYELFGDISIAVTEGRVVLTGSVPTRDDKIKATEIAWSTEGVRSVEDALTVAEDSGTGAYLADAWISNQVRYELLTDLDISSANYNVETVDNVVHLTGIARSTAELNHAIGHARSINGVERVVSHVLTIDDPRRIQAVADKVPAPEKSVAHHVAAEPAPGVQTYTPSNAQVEVDSLPATEQVY